MPAIAASLRLRGFRPTYLWLMHRQPGPLSDQFTPEQAARIMSEASEIVSLVARNYPAYRATCLPQSMMLWHILKREGFAAELQIGVSRVGGEFAAHAWVEYQGRVLNDSPDVAERYLPVDSIEGALRRL